MKQITFTANWSNQQVTLNCDNLTDNEKAEMIASRKNENGDCIE